MGTVYKNTDPDNIVSYDYGDKMRYYIFYNFLMVIVLTFNAIYYIILMFKLLKVAYYAKVVPNIRLALEIKNKMEAKK